MARPRKVDWEAIEKAYKEGIEVNEIVKYYKVAKKTLQNKIAEKKWRTQRNGKLVSHIDEFKEVLGTISREIQDDPKKQEIVIKKLSTILEDNELIGNNRELLKGFQRLIAKGLKSGTFDKPQDIRAGVGAVKDIEAVANPQASKTDVQVTNIQSAHTEIKVEWE